MKMERHTFDAKRRNFFWLCPFTFLALQVQLVVFVSAFVFDSTVWSVSVCFSSTHGAPQALPLPRAVWSRRHCFGPLLNPSLHFH